MQVGFIHCLWRYKNLILKKIETTTNESITILSVGTINDNSGPDFFAVQLKIG